MHAKTVEGDLIWTQAGVDRVQHVLEVVVGLYDRLVVQARSGLLEVLNSSRTPYICNEVLLVQFKDIH